MYYLEIKVNFSSADPWKEIFTSLLADAGCESFIDGDDENQLLCYVSQELYDEDSIKDVLENHQLNVTINYSVSKVEQQDWNAVWESNYTPVFIADRCYIRAPFHPAMDDAEFEIVIEPKMSFGTAHHETTSLMIEYLLDEDLKDKKVLDMGAGTGVLAILAHQKNARPITAIDNDEWAYRNNIENNARNHCEDIKVILGDAHNIDNDNFDVIIANINRNILYQDIPAYLKTLNPGGTIFLSGFYEENDLPIIKSRCEEFGLKYDSHKVKNKWTALKMVRK